MSKVSLIMRRSDDAYYWWCPGCKMMHPLPDGWTFNNDVKKPSFAPSFKHDWGNGKVCHYFIKDGQAHFCRDSSHEFKGKTVDMPEIGDKEIWD